jgi:hypothetical protein
MSQSLAINEARNGSPRPCHFPSNLHPVPLIELTGHGVRLPDGEVQVASRGHRDLIEEAVENRAPRPVELVSIHNLMKRDCTGRDVEVADTGAFPVSLEDDDYAVLEDALLRLDATTQIILADMREDFAVTGEEAVDGLQVSRVSETHFYTRA